MSDSEYFCTNCQARIDLNAKICPNCGKDPKISGQDADHIIKDKTTLKDNVKVIITNISGLMVEGQPTYPQLEVIRKVVPHIKELIEANELEAITFHFSNNKVIVKK